MRAVVLNEIGGSVAIEEDYPAPAADEAGTIVVKVVSAYVGTAFQPYSRGELHNPPPVPLVPGPGGVGEVVELGPGVGSLQVGQLVLIGSRYSGPPHNNPDAAPEAILIGWFPVTPNAGPAVLRFKHGSWAERQLLPVEAVFPVPPAVSERVPATHLLQVHNACIAHGALLTGGLAPGQAVQVIGATGRLGTFTLMLALAMGATRVFAVGRSQSKLERLVALDPARVTAVPLGDGPPAEALPQGAVQLSVDFLGPMTDTDLSEAALQALAPGGTAVFCGGVRGKVPVDYAAVLVKQLVIRGSFMYPPSSPATVMGFMAAGLFDFSAFLDVREHRFDDIHAAIEEAGAAGSPFELHTLSWD